MQTETKNLTVTDMDEKGKGLAIIADMSQVDHDDDTYEKGAFSWKGDQWCPLLPAHDRWVMPFGKARVYEDGDKAMAELHFNLNAQAGRDWHSALLFDLANGKSVQEYSYGFDTVEADYQIDGDKRVRILKRVDVHEVSTVVRGAGLGTGTVNLKNLKAAMKDGEFKSIIEQLATMSDILKGDPGLLSETGRKQLSDIHSSLGQALINPADAEAKAQAEIASLHIDHLTRNLPDFR